MTSFCQSLDKVTKRQSEILRKILSESFDYSDITSVEEFQNKVPLSNYSDWRVKIDAATTLGEGLTYSRVRYFQPSSGSTSQEKWIPYTDSFLGELNNASLAWIGDLYKRYPEIKKGKHYWSLSWLPDKYRDKRINDDLKVVSFFERQILKNVMALPWDVSKFPSSHTSLLATSVGLIACEELSLISIWSPTYLLSLFDFIAKNKETIINILEKRHWGEFEQLNKYPVPKCNDKTLQILKFWDGVDFSIFQAIWPNLVLISSWDSSTSHKWANELRKIFVNTSFQGKGLWATEGVVTFPFKGHYPLAINSHFYEFIDCETSEVLLPSKLKIGQRVKPVITTGSGLLRYQIEDRLRVTEYIGDTPCFEFEGRIKDVDMVGEKISHEISNFIVQKICKEYSIEGVCLIARDQKPKPYYSILVEKNEKSLQVAKFVSDELEKELEKNFHYKVARELGQLDHAQVEIEANSWEHYKRLQMKSGKIEGNIKHEPLIRI